MEANELLDLKIGNPDFDENLTIRGYLKLLLCTVWEEGECFSGKRPFGNSGWEYDLYTPLVRAGVVSGTLDEYGFIKTVEEREANRIICSCIDAAFGA